MDGEEEWLLQRPSRECLGAGVSEGAMMCGEGRGPRID
jgi:hypothetical protein